FVIAFYAAQRVGLVVVPVNPASAGPEVDYLLRDSGASALVFAPQVAGAVRAAATEGLPDGLEVLCLDEDPEYPDLIALSADAPAEPSDAGVTGDDNAEILYTSGTTGNPKGALFDQRQMMWHTAAFLGCVGMKDRDRLLHVAPLYHSAELNLMLLPGTFIGATHIVHDAFDPAAVLDAIETERITMMF